MNIETLDSDIAKEVLTILYCCDKNITDIIPEEVYKSLTSLAADSTLDIYIDSSKPLNEQGLQAETLDTFAAICYLYVADSEIQEKLLNAWIINDTKTDN